MANPVYGAHLSDWIWDAEHVSWYRVLQSPGHGCKYIWPETYRPTQPGKSPCEQPGLFPTSIPTQQNPVPPKFYELYFDLERPGPAWSSIPYTKFPESSRIARTEANRYILQPTRYFRQPAPGYTMGYCDDGRCQDPCCIETQIRKYGLRDDLKHHEDQDKNGNMRDGDNVGEHCPRTTGDYSDSDESMYF